MAAFSLSCTRSELFSGRGGDTVSMFFSGGVASTYHLCQRLLVDRRRVRPVYVSARIDDPDPSRGRLSVVEELRAIKRIVEMIRRRFPTASKRLLPVLHEPFIRIDSDVIAAQRRLFANTGGGGQYAGLCQWTRNQMKPGRKNIELAVLYGERTQRMHALIKANCKKEQDRYVVRSDRRRTDFGRLFSRVDFCLVDKDAGRMQSVARHHRFHDILTSTWTCWVPDRDSGRPCGRCAGCADRRRFMHIGEDVRSQKVE